MVKPWHGVKRGKYMTDHKGTPLPGSSNSVDGNTALSFMHKVFEMEST